MGRRLHLALLGLFWPGHACADPRHRARPHPYPHGFGDGFDRACSSELGCRNYLISANFETEACDQRLSIPAEHDPIAFDPMQRPQTLQGPLGFPGRGDDQSTVVPTSPFQYRRPQSVELVQRNVRPEEVELGVKRDSIGARELHCNVEGGWVAPALRKHACRPAKLHLVPFQ